MKLPALPPLDTVLTRADYSRLAKEIDAMEHSESTRHVAMLASFTTDFLKPCLTVEAARRGLKLNVWLAPFGQIEQQALDPASDLHAEKADVVLILPQLEQFAPDLAFRFMAIDAEALENGRLQVIARLRAVVQSIRAASNAKILLANFAPPAWHVAGLADAGLDISQAGFLQRLNEDIASLCRVVPDALVLDVARVATEVGLNQWRDLRMEFLAKSPWSATAMSNVAGHAARRMRPWFMPTAKCLVLDLDNTLWGGVLGEVGLQGISLGPDYPGNVFVDFQRRILALRDCGVLLAVASKNNAADVAEALAQHPSCLLKREHLAAFEVHWEDKATSLRRIASKLNIGVDALVFFDDNPAERAWVRDQLPHVTVIDVPANPMGYSSALAGCGCFDIAQFTSEDRRRSALYTEDLHRHELREQSGSLEDFLRGLDMTLTFGQASADSLPRIAQMLGKTNQFNLTTRRHGEADLHAMIDAGGLILWARLRDRFGDNGLIAAGIVLPDSSGAWRLDSFLMSCRVIGRGAETALLSFIMASIKSRYASSLHAEFIPTSKNQPAAAFLPSHGFTKSDASPLSWVHSLQEAVKTPSYFRTEALT